MGKLSSSESDFFSDLIKKYLFPLDTDRAQQERITMELKDLRNKGATAFLMLNALLVVVVFTLQITKNSKGGLNIPWPACEKQKTLFLEPVGLMFLLFYGVIITLQVLGMIVHRFGTFLHIVASTRLGCEDQLGSDKTKEKVAGAIELAKQLGRLEGADEDDRTSIASADSLDVEVTRKKTIHKISRHLRTQQTNTMSKAFKKRFNKLKQGIVAAEETNADVGQLAVFRQIDGRRMNAIRRRRTMAAIANLAQERQRLANIPQEERTAKDRWRSGFIGVTLGNSGVNDIPLSPLPSSTQSYHTQRPSPLSSSM